MGGGNRERTVSFYIQFPDELRFQFSFGTPSLPVTRLNKLAGVCTEL